MAVEILSRLQAEKGKLNENRNKVAQIIETKGVGLYAGVLPALDAPNYLESLVAVGERRKKTVENIVTIQGLERIDKRIESLNSEIVLILRAANLLEDGYISPDEFCLETRSMSKNQAEPVNIPPEPIHKSEGAEDPILEAINVVKDERRQKIKKYADSIVGDLTLGDIIRASGENYNQLRFKEVRVLAGKYGIDTTPRHVRVTRELFNEIVLDYMEQKHVSLQTVYLWLSENIKDLYSAKDIMVATGRKNYDPALDREIDKIAENKDIQVTLSKPGFVSVEVIRIAAELRPFNTSLSESASRGRATRAPNNGIMADSSLSEDISGLPQGAVLVKNPGALPTDSSVEENYSDELPGLPVVNSGISRDTTPTTPEVNVDKEGLTLGQEDKFGMGIILRAGNSRLSLESSGISISSLDRARIDKIVKDTRESLGEKIPSAQRCAEIFIRILSQFRISRKEMLTFNREDADATWILMRFFTNIKDSDIDKLAVNLPSAYLPQRREPSHAGRRI